MTEMVVDWNFRFTAQHSCAGFELSRCSFAAINEAARGLEESSSDGDSDRRERLQASRRVASCLTVIARDAR